MLNGSGSFTIQQAFLKPLLGKFDIKGQSPSSIYMLIILFNLLKEILLLILCCKLVREIVHKLTK